MLFCLALFLFELSLAQLFLEGLLNPWMALALHGTACSIGFLVLRSQKFKARKINLYLITLALTATTGVFGAGIGLLTAVLFSYNKGKKSDPLAFLGLEDNPFDKVDEEPKLVASLSEEDIKNKAQVIPFKDVLSNGSLNQKMDVLSKISRHYRPEFSQILMMAKKDKRNNIRVLSASTIAKIDQQFMRLYKNLSLKHRQYSKSPALLLSLARHASAYADCGILDVFRQKHFREKSIQYFRDYLAIKPQDIGSHLTLAKVYLKNGETEASIKIFTGLLKSKVKLGLVDLFWYLETLYEGGHFNLIRQRIQSLEKAGVLSKNHDFFILNNILKPWAKGQFSMKNPQGEPL